MMSDNWVDGINDMLAELDKINHKMRRLNATRDMLNGYISYMEKESADKPKDSKKAKENITTISPKEPSKEDFKTTCDSLLKQLKEARIKIDELTDENKELNNAISSLEDTNRILLTTIDILNNKLEDMEEFLYEHDMEYDEYEEEDEQEKCKPKQEKKE